MSLLEQHPPVQTLSPAVKDFILRSEALDRHFPLAPGGRIVSLVAFDIQSRHGHAGAFVALSEAASVLPEAIALFLAGRLQIITDTIFDLDDTRAALEKLSTGHARGKILIRTTNG